MRQSIILLLVTLSACVTVRHGNVSSSGIDLNEEFQIIDIAQGVSVNFSAFGINEGGKDAMILDARRNLYANYPLKPYQQFANYSVDFKTTYLLFFKQIKVIVSADVIEKSDPYAPLIIDENLANTRRDGEKTIQIGDTLLFANALARAIKIHPGNGRVSIAYYDTKGAFRTRVITKKSALNFKQLYLTKNSLLSTKEIQSDDYLELRAPENPKNKIVTFRLNDKIYKGEFIEENHGAYLIMCITKSGKRVGFLIGKEDILEE